MAVEDVKIEVKSDSSMQFSDEEEEKPLPHIQNIIKNKRIQKFDLKEYKKRSYEEQETLSQLKGRSGIANYDTYC